MTDLDTIFDQLARQPVDDRLGSIDSRIFSRAQLLRDRRSLRSTAASFILGALAIGLTSGLLPDQRAAASALTILWAPPPLAPSKLLGAGYEP